MTPEEFTKFVHGVIREEICAGPPCSCGCGQTDIEGRSEAVSRIVDAVTKLGMFSPEREKCTRCGAYVAPT